MKRKHRKQHKYYLRRYTSLVRLVLHLVVIGVVSSLLFYIVFRSGYFDITEVSVAGTSGFVNVDDVRVVTEAKVLGKNIFSADTADIEYCLENNFLAAKDFVVVRVYPKTIQVQIIEREPTAIISNDLSDKPFLIDNAGYVLGFSDPQRSDLPKIKYENDIIVGMSIDKDLVPVYMELTQLFERNDIPISKMSANPNYFSIYLKDGTEVLIGNKKDKFSAVTTVVSLLKQFELESKIPERIDLRYDKVIVSFKSGD